MPRSATVLRHRLATGIVAMTVATGLAQSDTVGSEFAVKAAIVYKIAKFVTWPDTAFQSADEPLSICLPADDPVRPAMTGLTGDSIRGRSIEIRLIASDTIATIDCEVLFVSDKSTSDPQLLLDKVARRPVLTVGDAEDFHRRGGIVSLQVRNNRVRFAIDADASATAGLGISAQLLQIAGRSSTGQANP